MNYHRASIIVLFLTLSLIPVGPVAAADVPLQGEREVREIAAGWRFAIDLRDVGEREHWYDSGWDSSGWSEVEVPKAWDTFDEALRGYEGVGWYSVALDGSWARAGKVQHLTFGRVMYHTKVWLNGELLGEHIDGYLPFAFDVTGKLKDSANQLVLRVDNRPRIDWLPAAKQIEWVQYGGILQPVRLETQESDLSLGPCDPGGSRGRGGIDLVARSTSMLATERRRRLVFRIAVRGGDEVSRRHWFRSAAPGRRGPSRQELSMTLGRADALVAGIAEACTPWSRQSNGRRQGDRSLGLALRRQDDRGAGPADAFERQAAEDQGRQPIRRVRPLRPESAAALVEDELRLMKKTGRQPDPHALPAIARVPLALRPDGHPVPGGAADQLVGRGVVRQGGRRAEREASWIRPCRCSKR